MQPIASLAEKEGIFLPLMPSLVTSLVLHANTIPRVFLAGLLIPPPHGTASLPPLVPLLCSRLLVIGQIPTVTSCSSTAKLLPGEKSSWTESLLDHIGEQEEAKRREMPIRALAVASQEGLGTARLASRWD